MLITKAISQTKSLLFGVVAMLYLTGASSFAKSISLTLQEAVSFGLEQNLTVTDRLIDARQSALEWIQVSGVYDTELTANLYYADSELSPATSPISSAAEILHADIGMNRQFSSGTRVGLGASTDNVQFPDSSFASENNQTAVTLSLLQPLLRNAWGGEVDAAVEAARLRYDAAWRRYLDARDEVALDIHRTFWTSYGQFAIWDVVQESLDRAGELLEINQRREKDGVLDETDVLDAEASLATQTVDVLAQQDEFIRSKDALFALLQWPMMDWEKTRLNFEASLDDVDLTAMDDPLELYSIARENRMDFAALEKQLESVDASVEQAEQALRPELNLFGEIQVGNTDESWSDSVAFDKTSWTVGIEFRRGWNRNAEKSQLRSAELERNRLENTVAQAEQNLLLACRRSVRDLITIDARIEASGIARRLNQRKLILEQRKYDQGRSDSRRIIDFQEDLKQSEGQEIQALAQRLIRSAEQLRLAGRLVNMTPDEPEESQGELR